jgi:magnesium transporter
MEHGHAAATGETNLSSHRWTLSDSRCDKIWGKFYWKFREREFDMTTPQVSKEEHLNIESVIWGGLSWVNIEQPTKHEIEYLAQNYHFHTLDLDDCLSHIQLPKIDEYEDYLFLVLHFQVFNKATRISRHTQVSVFIGEKYLISLHTGDLTLLTRLFKDCQSSEESRREYLGHGSGYLLYYILDSLVDAYFPVLDKIMNWVEYVEDSAFDEKTETARELSLLRRDIITQRRIAFPMRTLTSDLGNKIQRFTKMDMIVHWGDLMDHENKICDALDEYKEIIDVYKDTDYVLRTDRLNRIMRTLTIISTIMLPLIVLSGLWSMNVPLPLGADPGGHHYFFFVIIAMLLIVVLGMLYFLHRKRWI